MRTKGLTESDLTALAELIGRGDSLHFPARWGTLPPSAFAAIHERRLEFLERGLPLTGSGPDGSRKTLERWAFDMERRGVLMVYVANQRRCARLTPEADVFLRAMSGWWSPADADTWQLLAKLADPRPEWLVNAGFVREHDLVGVAFAHPKFQKRANSQQWSAAALGARGWIESASDVRGVVGYRVTPDGLAALRAGPPKRPALPPYDDAQREFETRLFAATERAWDETIEGRQSWQPGNPSHVCIPLGAGSWSPCGEKVLA